MNHQDWKPVVLKPKIKQNKHGDKKVSYTQPKYKEDDGIPIKKEFPKDFGKKMQQARTDKGWTQKELAQKLNSNVSVIQEYEQNKVANPNKSFGRKIEAVLGSKLF